MIDCHYNMPPGACACDIPGPDFYDDDAQQLAAETAYELFEFSLLRGRRERQWQRRAAACPTYDAVHLGNLAQNEIHERRT